MQFLGNLFFSSPGILRPERPRGGFLDLTRERGKGMGREGLSLT